MFAKLYFCSGVVVSSGRGFDLYRAPDAHGTRSCRSASIVTHELDETAVAKSFGLAAVVAVEVRGLLIDAMSEDGMNIEAMVEASNDKQKLDRATRQMKLQLQEKKVIAWLQKMGHVLLETYSARDFVEDAEACNFGVLTEEGFQK